ncbi:MAG: hypothetical protein M3N59_00470 [bacterium]|nr:hypothetical protein [bacterium]
MQKPTILYDLGAIVRDDLTAQAENIAEALERDAEEVAAAITESKPAYDRGEITQSEHWGRVALKLALEEIDTLSMFAINGTEVEQSVLGRIRVQSPTHVLGLVSDATPDFVAHFRKRYQLDELMHVHVIGSELDERRDYTGLLKLAAERLQHPQEGLSFVDVRPVHLEAAKGLRMRPETHTS